MTRSRIAERLRGALAIVAGLALLCGNVAGAAVKKPGRMQVAVVWLHHQPFHPKRPGGNVYTQPWVRLHAVRNYTRLAELAARHPGMRVTINLTPSLLAQLEDLAGGATDRAYVLSSVDARILTAEQRREIHATFFAAGPGLMAPLPGYAALRGRPAGAYTVQDWRDLQVYFNLAWLAPAVLREPRMAGLVRKGRAYTENEKFQVLERHNALVREIIPAHARLEKAGRIEVITSPFAHPILPLLVDSDAAERGLAPGTPLPPRFRHPEDAAEHLRLAIAAYRRHFGRTPRGVWPAEGAVSQDVLPLFRQAGISWIATDERILEKTLGVPLRRGGRLVRPDLLTGLWRGQDGPAILFCDRELSALVASTYHAWEPERAARDLHARIAAIGKRLPPGRPAILGLLLDGDGPWESYPEGGDRFLGAFYRALAADPRLVAATPGDVFASGRPALLPRPLWAGARFDGGFSTWIGEADENAAWSLLGAARQAVDDHVSARGEDRRAARALAALHAAEGSDWFRWYGKDHDSGRDAAFDQAFRDYLAEAYRALGREVPENVLRPAGAEIPRRVAPPVTPSIDGRGGAAWRGAQEARRAGGVTPQSRQLIERMQVGGDREALYVAVDFTLKPRPTGLVLGFPRRPGGVGRPRVPFPVQFAADFQPGSAGTVHVLADPPVLRKLRTGWGASRLEAAIPWSLLDARGGEDLALQVLELGAAPYLDLPLHVTVPALPERAAISLQDPEGDAASPGQGGSARIVDITRFAVEDAGPEWVFVWTLAEIERSRGTKLGLGLTRLDAYVLLDPASGNPDGYPLLAGRAPRVPTPWRVAVAVDGARSGVYARGGGQIAKVRVTVDPERRTISAALPRSAIPGDPRRWAFLAGSLAPPDGTSESRPFLDLVGLPLPEGGSPALLDYLVPEM